MSVTINASTSSGLVQSADTSGTLDLQSNGTTAVTISSSNLQFNSGYGSVATAYGCRAWVNFNGTGTVAIRASGNVLSITDNGVGDYTVNFTTAMPDANYSVGGSIKYNTSTTAGTDMRFEIKSSTAMTASAFTVVCSNYTGTLVDMNTVVLNVFR
jgi:hypothetical protein